MLKLEPLPSTVYQNQKIRELQALARYGENPALGDFSDESFFQLHQSKLTLKNQLRSYFWRTCSPYLSTTNFSDSKEVQISGFDLQYSYQRSGLKINSTNPNKIIYPFGNFSGVKKSYGVFTRSGQTATYVALSTLRQIWSELNITSFEKLVYYETGHLLTLSKMHCKNSKALQVLFVDSSTLALNHKIPDPRKWDLLLIDSTCFIQDEEIFSNWVNSFLKSGVPVVLIRSHLKLDSLGIEYALLGSISLIIPKLTKFRFPYQRFTKTLFELCQIQGAFASLDQLYPFHFDPLVFKLGKDRLMRIKNNTQALVELLIKEFKKIKCPVKIHQFQHQFFLWIEFPQKVKPTKFKLLGRIFDFLGLPYRYAESFGMDFMTLSLFPNSNKGHTLRISPGDFQFPSYEQVAKSIARWAQQIPLNS